MYSGKTKQPRASIDNGQRSHITRSLSDIFFVGEIFSYQLAHNKQWAPMDRFFLFSRNQVYNSVGLKSSLLCTAFLATGCVKCGAMMCMSTLAPSCRRVRMWLYTVIMLSPVIIFVYNMRALGHLLPDRRLLFCYVSQFTHKIKTKMPNLSSFNAFERR